MSSPSVFKRYEIKYLLTDAQKAAVLSAMESHVEPDSFGRSIIRNLYYDTDNYRLVRRSLEKPIYKEKLRVRSYRMASPNDQVFIELKKKFDSMVYKRRTEICERDVAAYLAGKIEAPVKSQITAEIDYFLQFYESLAPRVFLSYEREAFFGKEDNNLRVTFDENILWRTTDLSLGAQVYGECLLKPRQTLMEIKTTGGIPLWMVEALTREKLKNTSYSKYGSVYTTMYADRKGEAIYA